MPLTCLGPTHTPLYSQAEGGNLETSPMAGPPASACPLQDRGVTGFSQPHVRSCLRALHLLATPWTRLL